MPRTISLSLSKARTAHTKPTSCNGRVRGSAAAYRPVALPGRGSAEHGGELRGHTRGVAEVEACGRVASVSCVALAVDPSC